MLQDLKFAYLSKVQVRRLTKPWSKPISIWARKQHQKGIKHRLAEKKKRKEKHLQYAMYSLKQSRRQGPVRAPLKGQLIG